MKRGSSGFTLIEMLVALLITAATLSGILALFFFATARARSQESTADLQQSLRTAQQELVRRLRMAGRGGLPPGPIPEGMAFAIRNDTPPSGPEARAVPADVDSPLVVEGSDVLTVRGVFSTPLYLVNPATDPITLQGDPAISGTIRLRDPSPAGIPQDLAPLREAAEKRRPEALLLVSPRGGSNYAVVELTGASSLPGASPGAKTLELEFRVTGGTHTDRYSALAPAERPLAELGGVWQVGLLEEYRYYVRRDETGGPGALCRARLYPGTDAPYAASASNLSVAVADRVLDLQVAVGIDRDGDSLVSEAAPPDSTDEWLFNSSGDRASDPGWRRTGSGRPTRLLYVRLTTVGRGTRPEPGYLAPPLGPIEDRRGEPTEPAETEDRGERAFRRWVLTAIVEPRNLS